MMHNLMPKLVKALGDDPIQWQGKMADPLIVEGNLMLWCQEGGFAADEFEIDGKGLDDLIAEHFSVERVMPMGHRPIGRVRITIEKLLDARGEEEGNL